MRACCASPDQGVAQYCGYGPAGLYTWPAAAKLAAYLHQHRALVAGQVRTYRRAGRQAPLHADPRPVVQVVLELGAGTGLAGIAAAMAGAAHVCLTDRADAAQVAGGGPCAQPPLHTTCNALPPRGPCQVLANCREAAALNAFPPAASVAVAPLTWGEFPQQAFQLPPAAVVLGADCLYDPAVFESLFATVHFLLTRHPARAARFITAYQNRRFPLSIFEGFFTPMF